MKQVLSLGVILAALLAVLFLLMPYVKTPGAGAPRESKSVQMTTAEIREESATYIVDARYPQFGIPAIDAQIKKAVEDAVAEFKSLPANPPDSATPQSTFDGSFESVYVGSDVVSVKLVFSKYTGGAHPITLVSGVNYERETARPLLLDDALRMIGKSVREVSAEASARFSREFGDGFFADGADTNPENFSSFVVSDGSVTFIFQQYQVAAYASGVQEVSFARIR